MKIEEKIYNYMSSSSNWILDRIYMNLVKSRMDEFIQSNFIDEFFTSQQEYYKYAEEFDDIDYEQIKNEAFDEYGNFDRDMSLGAISSEVAERYYCLIRKTKPDIIVETGVSNGGSTLAILQALNENNNGKLYSIDYPLRSDKSLEQFREETFEEYGGAAIPADKDPGWIIPDSLRQRWDLRIGKSQRKLPEIVCELESIDLFFHDSEHSHPCMMFEYELANEWLSNGGIIVSDDISWNDAFSIFTEVRNSKYGYLDRNVGYITKE